jgi:hypothetical protein
MNEYRRWFDEGRRSSSCFVEPLGFPLASAESLAGCVLLRSDQCPRPAFTSIVTYYNVRRFHQALGCRSPVEFVAVHASPVAVRSLPEVRGGPPHSAPGPTSSLCVDY